MTATRASPTQFEATQLELAERFLVNRHAHLAAAVLRLGEVHFSEAVATAGIVTHGAQVRLYFNRTFLRRINVLELAGVLAHEALHFCLRHQERHQAIPQQRDRWLFKLSCEAVINDLIADRLASLKLPDAPITGATLLGRKVSGHSAEEVMGWLRESLAGQPAKVEALLDLDSVDDHSLWDEDPALPGDAPSWTEETTRLAAELFAEAGPRDATWGHLPRGAERELTTAPARRTDLARFLLETIWSANRYDTDWTRPSRKLVAVYPEVILPNYDPAQHHRVLIAIDASGSIPAGFLTAALVTARQPLAHTTVSLVSFDTEVYPVDRSANSVRGGGGTSVQAVEAFIAATLPGYPDTVFCLTDGFFAPPQLKHPDRWVWIVTPDGSREHIPPRGRIETFAVEPVT